MEPEGSLPYSQTPVAFPHPEPIALSLSPACVEPNDQSQSDALLNVSTSKVQGRPLSAVRDRLFNITVATLHIWRPFLHPQPEDVSFCGYGDPGSIKCSEFDELKNN